MHVIRIFKLLLIKFIKPLFSIATDKKYFNSTFICSKYKIVKPRESLESNILKTTIE